MSLITILSAGFAISNVSNTIPGAATWIAPGVLSASSLDTGRIGYLVAWGGDEFGYAYTYSLSGAPSGVVIDSDTGIVCIGSVLSAGSYNFNVIVTNREVTSKNATFPITLNIAQGVTSGRTGTQVLHKTYDPLSGTYGSPTGNNFTTVLNNMQTAALADQANTGGDDLLHTTFIFKRGRQYDYTKNNWLTGLQNFIVKDDPAFPNGAIPILRCTNAGSIYDNGPLNIGYGNAFLKQDNPPGIKSFCALINSANVGANTIILKTAGQSSRIKAGRWHLITCGTQQIGGFPPNQTYFDYVKVVSVSGANVVLDRPLRYRYSDTFYEDVNDDQSFGRAWIVPMDLGGSGGALSNEPRMTQRAKIQNINFAVNPNGVDGISLFQNFIDLSIEGCNITNPQPTMSKHVLFANTTITSSGEPDKVMETLIFDNCNFFNTANTVGQEMGGASGAQYVLSRNTHFSCIQVSPRQWRSLNCIHDATNNTDIDLPFTISYNGPILYYHFKGCTFKPGPNSGSGWSWQNPPYAPIRIGIDATWSGNRLIIPSSFTDFGTWLNALYEGVIISVSGTAPITTNWGYVNNLTSPNDGSAIWVDITWVNGTKPTSGNIYPNARLRRLNFENDNVMIGTMSWNNPNYMKQTIRTVDGLSWTFPTGYPSQYQ